MATTSFIIKHPQDAESELGAKFLTGVTENKNSCFIVFLIRGEANDAESKSKAFCSAILSAFKEVLEDNAIASPVEIDSLLEIVFGIRLKNEETEKVAKLLLEISQLIDGFSSLEITSSLGINLYSAICTLRLCRFGEASFDSEFGSNLCEKTQKLLAENGLTEPNKNAIRQDLSQIVSDEIDQLMGSEALP